MKRSVVIATALAACFGAGCIRTRVNAEIPDINIGGGGSGPSQLPSEGKWGDVIRGAGDYLAGSEYGYLFYAYDTLAYPGEPIELVARVQQVDGLKAIPGVTVGFFHRRELIGTALTDDGGYAVITVRPLREGDYRYVAKVITTPSETHDDLLRCSPAPLLVAARDRRTPMAVIDLDHTLAAASFAHVLLGTVRPMPHSVAVTRRIAREYTVVYLTHRPQQLTRKSKLWLTDNGYPAGPLMLSRVSDLFSGSGKFKSARLDALREVYPNVRIGIGDKVSDAQAYASAGLDAYLIPHYKRKPKDMRKLAKEIRALPRRGRLAVVTSWREIEAGIFDGVHYPPDEYASWLDRDASGLEAEKRRKNRDDDDEDDD